MPTEIFYVTNITFESVAHLKKKKTKKKNKKKTSVVYFGSYGDELSKFTPLHPKIIMNVHILHNLLYTLIWYWKGEFV